MYSTGIFNPKPCSPGVKLGWYSDGCALFYKNDAFDLISQTVGTYNVGTQVYIVATLRHKSTGRVIVVAVTHLKAKHHPPSNEQMRICQVKELLQCVKESVDRAASEFSTGIHHVGSSSSSSPSSSSSSIDIPIVVMGDFNSHPNNNGKDKGKDDDEDQSESCIQSVLSSQQIQLSSAYCLDSNDNDGNGIFTTWKTRGDKTVRRIIDYIFHNSNSNNGSLRSKSTSTSTSNDMGFRCTQVLSIPKDDEIEVEKLPGLRYPSDHMSIGARFEIEKMIIEIGKE